MEEEKETDGFSYHQHMQHVNGHAFRATTSETGEVLHVCMYCELCMTSIFDAKSAICPASVESSQAPQELRSPEPPQATPQVRIVESRPHSGGPTQPRIEGGTGRPEIRVVKPPEPDDKRQN